MSANPARRARLGAALAALSGLTLSLLLAPTATARPAGDDAYDPSIIGGTIATIDQAPWQAALVFADAANDYLGQYCGGSIISSWEIVTAAHCVVDGGAVFAPSDIRVMTGSATLSTTARTGVPISSITVHPDYVESTFESDIAVLRLAEPIALIPGVQQAIALQRSVVSDLVTARISGWGNISTTSNVYPTELRQASVTKYDDYGCAYSYPGEVYRDDLMLCAIGPGFTTDTCQGDSGGPLAVQTDEVWYLAGITSWGHGCAQYPTAGVYTEVSAFAAWVDDQLLGSPQVARISGTSRFDTAVAISQAGFPSPITSTPVVFVASGTNFPDALSAGPVAAAMGGPLLLTSPTSLPASVKTEIERLNPDKIYVVGAASAVSNAVYAALSPLAPSIERVSGPDRYATSRAVTALGFESAETVYVATGTGFADALAAGAAAGTVSAPVILVPGRASTADLETRALISDLGATSIVVAGGPPAVSEGMFASLDTVADAERRSGPSRIDTAVAVNAAAFTSSDFVYLTNAYSFPDALAGGVLATLEPGPMFTVPGTCVPASVRSAITALGAQEVRLLGGPNALSVQVAALRTC